MLTKRIKYTDYDGNQREEDFYFYMSRPELIEMNFETSGGMDKRIQRIIDAEDTNGLLGIFKDIIVRSYGEKSLDGKHFVKSPEITRAFTQTEAYSELYMELATDHKAGIAFLNAIIPQSMAAEFAANEKVRALTETTE